MRVIEYIKTPRHILFGIFRRYGCFIKNDRRYLEWFWYLKFGKKLDLDNPRTYNEKLQWLKLYDRREEYTRMIDKIDAKEFVGIPHGRVDLYNCNGRIYFGEMTFFHWSGAVAFEPDDLDYKMGEWLHLPKIKETI